MAITETTDIMKSLLDGEVLSGIQSIELYDLDDTDGTTKKEIAGDTLIDTFSLTQDDSDITEIKNEKNQLLKEIENKMPYKATLSLARWKDAYFDYFNIKRVTRGATDKKETGIGFVNLPLSISKRMIVRFAGTPVYIELPEVTLRSKASAETLRTSTFNAILNFTAKEDENDIPLYMWEPSPTI